MTSEPFEVLDQALREVASQSQDVQERIARLDFLNTPEGNRRSLTAQGQLMERRQGERRAPSRATPGRRQLHDRRLPLQQRVKEYEIQLSKLLERTVRLYQLKQLQQM